MTPATDQHALLIVLHGDILLRGDSKYDSETIPRIIQRTYPLLTNCCIIGRDLQQCHIGVPSNRTDISRVHAKITRHGPRYILEDNHSRHGTFVNGQRIDTPRELATDDILGFAASKDMLRFVDPKQLPAVAPLPEPLTEREVDILRLLAEGRQYQELADQLHISKNTVKSHMRNIFGKLAVKNALQAIEKAHKLRLM